DDFAGRGDFIANAYAVYGGPETEAEEATSTSEEEAGKETEATSTSEEEAGKETEAASTSEEKEAGKETEAASTSEEKEDGKETEATSTSEEKEAGKETEATSTSEEKEAGKETEATSTSEEKEAGKETEAASTSEEKEAEKETEIGIASARFELLPDLSKIPEGKGKVVTEGKRVYVKVPEILQTPELPTGCESVALTIVLNSMGYELEKTEIMKNYLEKGTDMATSYVGDPFSTRGAGCFPPAIAAAANKFLDEKKDGRKGYNITGADIEELCDYIDKGTPAIIWSSMYMADPAKAGGTYSYQGQTYEWYRAEHCVVLYGYDKEKKVYLVSDPLVGLVERDAEAFKRIYDQIGKYAVVIY
ncbi:MAG: C39 family peptidase, partial [Eubacterium sp.]|nr:C39 family peptidase [Eubacterium sp.]